MLAERLGSVAGGLEVDVAVQRGVIGKSGLDIQDGSPSSFCQSVLFH